MLINVAAHLNFNMILLEIANCTSYLIFPYNILVLLSQIFHTSYVVSFIFILCIDRERSEALAERSKASE